MFFGILCAGGRCFRRLGVFRFVLVVLLQDWRGLLFFLILFGIFFFVSLITGAQGIDKESWVRTVPSGG